MKLLKQSFIIIRQTAQSMRLKCIFLVMLGSMIQAIGVCNIHAFSDVTEGGTLGLTLLLYHWTGISPAITSLILNAGCYAFGWRVLGKSFLAYSAVSVGFYSLCYGILESFAPLWPGILSSPMACAIIGAVFVGVGAGISILGGGAPGGDDALAMGLSKSFNCGIQHIYLISDLSVLLISLTYIPFSRIAYSLLTVILSGQIVGWIQRLKEKI